MSESFYIISLSHPPETVEKKGGRGRILQPYTKNRLLQIDTWKLCMLLNYIYTVNDFTEGNKFYGIHGMC